MKTKVPLIFVNRGLYSLDKDEISNLSPDPIYFKCHESNQDFV